MCFRRLTGLTKRFETCILNAKLKKVSFISLVIMKRGPSTRWRLVLMTSNLDPHDETVRLVQGSSGRLMGCIKRHWKYCWLADYANRSSMMFLLNKEAASSQDHSIATGRKGHSTFLSHTGELLWCIYRLPSTPNRV